MGDTPWIVVREGLKHVMPIDESYHKALLVYHRETTFQLGHIHCIQTPEKIHKSWKIAAIK